jgi:hypothetical protein
VIRKSAGFSGLAIVSALLLWRGCSHWADVGAKQPSDIDASALGAEGPSETAGDSVTEAACGDNESPQPAYRKFYLDYAASEDQSYIRVGYRNYWGDANKYYAWKGVIFRPGSHIVGLSGSFPNRRFFTLKAFEVIEVDPPPLHYLQLRKGGYAPGYYHAIAEPTFFRWDDVVIKESQVPLKCLSKRVIVEKDQLIINVVLPPREMLRNPHRWRKD